MSAYDSTMLFVCALCAGLDIGEGHFVRGAFGVFACVVFVVVATVKR